MHAQQSILIVEDDVKIAEWLRIYCERAEFSTIIAHDGLSGLELARSECPDLVILDLMLPQMDGLEVCRILRRESTVPIIMLTARGDQPDRIEGLERGADDYVVKPFDPNEVVARIKAVLRRTRGRTQRLLHWGNIELDEELKTVHIANRPVSLTQIQFELLATFMRHPNQVLAREQLIESVFQNNYDAFDRAIDGHIKRLRKLITHENVQPIETVYGQGYRFFVEKGV